MEMHVNELLSSEMSSQRRLPNINNVAKSQHVGVDDQLWLLLHRPCWTRGFDFTSLTSQLHHHHLTSANMRRPKRRLYRFGSW